jgi:hypothetical protein
MEYDMKHLVAAVAFDRDDPFVARRVASHDRNGAGQMHDYTRSRRLPAPIEDRFRLSHMKRKG